MQSWKELEGTWTEQYPGSNDIHTEPKASASREIVALAKAVLSELNVKGSLETEARKHFGSKGRIKQVDATWEAVNEVGTAIGWVYELTAQDDPSREYLKETPFGRQAVFIGFVGLSRTTVDDQLSAPIRYFGVTPVDTKLYPSLNDHRNMPELSSYQGRITDDSVRSYIDNFYGGVLKNSGYDENTNRQGVYIGHPGGQVSSYEDYDQQQGVLAALKSPVFKSRFISSINTYLHDLLDYKPEESQSLAGRPVASYRRSGSTAAGQAYGGQRNTEYWHGDRPNLPGAAQNPRLGGMPDHAPRLGGMPGQPPGLPGARRGPGRI